MSSKKNRRHARPAPVVQERSKGIPWPFIAIAVAVVAGAGLYMAWGSSGLAPSLDATGPTAQAPTTTAATAPDASPTGDPGSIASAVSGTALTAEGPNDLPMPPLPYTSQMSGSPEQVRQAYVFAAQNPGVLGYVPCYCGCELDGHHSNADCFVESRAANGAVQSWDTHGMTWPLCLSVARDAMQMHALGASVADIQGAVITKYAATYPTSTPTPAVPQ